jgi:hypothetical protein
VPAIEHDWFLEPGEFSLRGGAVYVTHPVLAARSALKGEDTASDTDDAEPIARARLQSAFLDQQTLRRVLSMIWANRDAPLLKLNQELKRGSSWRANTRQLEDAVERLAQAGLIVRTGTGPAATARVAPGSAHDLLRAAAAAGLNLELQVPTL